MTCVELKDLTISYDRHPAVHHMNGAFKQGSLTAITGPNGAGKSSLLKGIAGIKKAEKGQIIISKKVNNIAYLPQVTELERDFPMSVLHMVTTGFWYKTGGIKFITSEMKKSAINAIEMVGLRGFAKRQLNTLSSGQFQRALFARLLVQDAELILLDEPFTAIDTDTTIHLLEIIQNWHAEKRTVICVLHDFNQIRAHFPECVLLAHECIAWGVSNDVLCSENLLRGRVFHEAWNQLPKVCEQ